MIDKNELLLVTETMIIVVLLLVTGTLVLYNNQVESINTDLKEEHTLELIILNNDLIKKNNTITELTEKSGYCSNQLKTEKNNKQDLQLIYNDLFTDAVNCYWANNCLYFPDSCEERFEGVGLYSTARELHAYYSDECDLMIRDWQDYYDADSSIGE